VAAAIPPLLRRFPALAAIPRAPLLATSPTPVQRSDAAPALWVKRDDLSAPLLGGNKVRALEYLLAGVGAHDVVLTVGGRGSTHALSTVLHAHRLGARAAVVRWSQEMNDAAHLVAQRLAREADHVQDARTVAGAYLRAVVVRAAARLRGHALHWVPAGGTTPLGILGHVGAALELASQVEQGLLPEPARIVVPLGTGGTAAGLALGVAIAGLRTRIVGARVVPRVVANRRRILTLAERTARVIERASRAGGQDVPVPRPTRASVRVEHIAYGGAYGRETPAARDAAARFTRAHADCRLDATYSAKAFAVALAACDGKPTVFWLTFDGRWM
jgi:D-cysteine desulfhydrase